MSANTIDANAKVCTRCQTVVPVQSAPTRQRRSLWWSRRGGIGFGGAGWFTPGKVVCAYCGGSSIVPAGAPRGQKILGSGVVITGHLSSTGGRSSSLIALFVGGILVFGILAAIFNSGNNSTTSSQPAAATSTSVEQTPEQQAAAAKARAAEVAAAKKKSAADHALQYNMALAATNDVIGLLRMGERYRDGDGVEKDLAKAKDYLQRAAAAGSPTAADELKRLAQ